ncbi:Guanine nucleotide exchange factor for Cdc42p [Batrachochytrium dendrobatidis]|nr:Guanine nucleotide exchange factor for Cdc42p [Batrachochytrium dendrobatidis]
MEIARPVQTNRTSDNGTMSLYQQTLSLIEKLYSLPDFERFLFPNGIEAFASESGAIVVDPIQVLFGCFRLGAPLCVLFNHLGPHKLLPVTEVDVTSTTYTNVSKKCVYHFLVGVKDELGVPEDQLFSLSDLYKDDTNALVKAIKTITIVVDDIERRGLLPPLRPLPFNTNQETEKPTDNRARVVMELLETERLYITSLQELLTYENELLSNNSIVNKDMIYKIFANLPDLVDFQRRFLISMETTLSLPQMDQRIGALFINNEEGFSVYEPMCGNYDNACKLALQETAILSTNPRIDPARGLQGYLIKPVQRICKYPLLLNELIKLSSPEAYPYYNELVAGKEAIMRVTERVNETKRVEENRHIKQDISDRVEDWKGLRLEDFGNLLLTDKFYLVSHDSEKEYVLFLFERMFLCLKESKKKKKRNGPEETVYTIKGNIHLSSIGKVDDNSVPASQHFELVVHWRDIGEMEAFPLKCRNLEQATLWKGRLDQLLYLERQRRMSVSDQRAHETAARMASMSLAPSPDLHDADVSVDEPKRTHSLYHTNASANDLKLVSRKSSPVSVRPGDRRPTELSPRTSSINGPNAAMASRPSVVLSRGQSSLSVTSGMSSKPMNGVSTNDSSVAGYPFHPENMQRSRSSTDPATGTGPQWTGSIPTLPSQTQPQLSEHGVPMSTHATAQERRVTLASLSHGGVPTTGSSGNAFGGSYFMPSLKKKDLKKMDDRNHTKEEAVVPSVEDVLMRSGLAGEPISTFAANGGSGSNASTTQALPTEYIPSPPISTPGSPGAYQRSQMLGAFPGQNAGGGIPGVSRLQTDLRSMPPSQLQGPHSPRGVSHMSYAQQLPPQPPRNVVSPQPQISMAEYQQYQQQHHPPQQGPGYYPTFQAQGYQQMQEATHRSQRASMSPEQKTMPLDSNFEQHANGHGGISISTAISAGMMNRGQASASQTSASSGPAPTIGLPPVPLSSSGNRAVSPLPSSVRSQEEAIHGNYSYHQQYHRNDMTSPTLHSPPAIPNGTSSIRERMTSPIPGPRAHPTTSTGSSSQASTSSIAPLIKIKTYYGDDVILIAVPSRGTTYRDLVSKITRKIRLNNAALPEGREIRLRYRDEEGDYVSMNGDDDVMMAFELARNGSDRGLVHITAQ